MAQASEDAQNQQPGAADVVDDGNKEQDKEKELEEMKKLLAAKDAEIAALKAQNETSSDDKSTADGGGDNDESKAPPKTDVTLSIRGIPEFDSYPFAMAAEKFFYMASIKAPYFREDDRASIDLVCVVDESGSMSGDRIKLVKETVQFIIQNLESGDRFGIVGYSSGSREVLALTQMDGAGKKKALAKAAGLRAQGGTALCQGLVDGVNMMRKRTSKNEIASVMILTDGQANQGPTSASDINASVVKGKVMSVQGGYGGYGGYGGPPPQLMAMNAPQMVMNRIQPQQMMNMMPMQMQQAPQQIQMQQGPPQIQMQQGPPQIQGQMASNISAPQQMPQSMRKKVMKKKQVKAQGPPKLAQQTQIQGGPPGPSVAKLPTPSGPPGPPGPPKPNDMIAAEDEAKQQPEGDTDEGSEELPCTINTFGFGSGHNDQLLKAIAENGRGMYAYIENTDQISDTFAECLGGLVSIIGQNLKVQVQALNNVEINRCLSKGYTVKVDIPKKKHTISLKDLQSEESRDFVFELKVPQIEAEKKEDPLVQLSIHYDNVVKGSTETLTNICNITRIAGKQIGERNVELDLQYNRVLATDAMAQASKLADTGKLAEARKVLTSAQEHIKKSKSNKDEYCVNLVKDMEKIQSNMVDRSAYRSKGAKMMSMNCQSQMMQRSTNSTAYASQSTYESRGKKKMKSKFRKQKGGY